MVAWEVAMRRVYEGRTMSRVRLVGDCGTRCRTRAVLALIAGVGLGTPLAAQDRDLPSRPALPERADTNSAEAYYDLGVMLLTEFARRPALDLRTNPSDADRAFYWASRLAPEWAEPLHGRRIAQLIDYGRLPQYLEGRRGVLESSDVRAIDEFERRARLRDPFLIPRFDDLLVIRYCYVEGGCDLRLESKEVRAYWQQLNGDVDGALALYAELAPDSPRRVHFYAQRAQLFHRSLQYDSTLSNLEEALRGLQEVAGLEHPFVYESRAMLEFSRGHVLEELDRWDEARDAYAAAATADQSFHRAHQRLAVLALAAGDTVTALVEYRSAVELAPNQAGPHLAYGTALMQAGRPADAENPLERAIELEPYWADPYLLLGVANEQQGDVGRAVARYREFLARAALNDLRRPMISQQIENLVGGR